MTNKEHLILIFNKHRILIGCLGFIIGVIIIILSRDFLNCDFFSFMFGFMLSIFSIAYIVFGIRVWLNQEHKDNIEDERL